MISYKEQKLLGKELELLSKSSHNLFTTDGVIDFNVSCIYVPRFESLREEMQATRLRSAKKEPGAVGELQSISITTYCVARKFPELLLCDVRKALLILILCDSGESQGEGVCKTSLETVHCCANLLAPRPGAPLACLLPPFPTPRLRLPVRLEEYTGCGPREPYPTPADFRTTRPTTTSDFHCSQISV